MFIHFCRLTIQGRQTWWYWMYYKDYLPLIRRTDWCSLQECLVTEIKAGKEKRFLTCLYGSPSQNDDQLGRICSDLKNFTLSCSIFIDIDAETRKIVFHWQSYKADITKDNIASTSVYNHMINTPTHFTNASSSCTDSIFF